MWKYGRYSERKKRKSPFSPIPLSFKVWLLRCIFRISGRSTIPRPQLRCLHRTESAFRAPIIQTVVDLSPPLLWLSTTMSVTLLPLRRQPPGGSSTCEDTFICFPIFIFIRRYIGMFSLAGPARSWLKRGAFNHWECRMFALWEEEDLLNVICFFVVVETKYRNEDSHVHYQLHC